MLVTEDNVIEVKNVQKKFRIYHEKRNTLFESLTALFNREKYYEEITVLDDISFTVRKGEMIGIIGLNGSGKTTLLRLLTGIYRPSSGKIIVRGKSIPFLELGAGFQPDLTAKENIILYGVILGFTKSKIKEKVDDIIKFAELEKFSDIKIKNFSAGMHARLAFSTAIQVDPDILFVDEILSVGDLPFQKKSFETFMQFKKKGKSIVFVSHSLDSVRDLCDRAIFIHKGRIHSIGEPSVVINAYRSVVDNISTIEQLRNRGAVEGQKVEIDNEILELRPWYYDFSKFGINTGLENLSHVGTKNQKFVEPTIISFIDRAFRDLSNKNTSLLNMFSYDDAYYTFYSLKNFQCNKARVLCSDQNEIQRLKVMSKKLEVRNMEWKLQSPHSLSEKEKFDIVLNINGLHMVLDPENVLKITNKVTNKFAIIESVVSLENEEEDYFETPAPGWTWGSRFSKRKIEKWVRSLDWKIVDSRSGVLEYNQALKERGFVCFLCKKD